jgi:acylphosphatase
VTGPEGDGYGAGFGERCSPADAGLLAGGTTEERARLTAWVRGRVQGVGFRWWVRKNALELGVLGFAENLMDGRVKVIAEGERRRLAELLDRLDGPGAPGQVAQVTHRWDSERGGLAGFVER